MKKYLLYLLRWQLSTPILAIVLYCMDGYNTTVSTIVANLIGGLIFFWIDKYIFKRKPKLPLWEITSNAICVDCGKSCIGYRIVDWQNYNRENDTNPEYRCKSCSHNKFNKIKSQRGY